jgi:hypothetical protein
MAANRLVVGASDGGAVTLDVDGRDVGVPGTTGEPWSRTFVAPGSRSPTP